MNNTSVSAIIIAKNEEENIGRCLDSLRSSVDEIIVIIDEYSTDNTLQIVKEKAVKYEVRPWQGYVKTKQYAVKQTLNDWILWIDADEALTAELSDEIKNGIQAIYINIRVNHLIIADNKCCWIKR